MTRLPEVWVGAVKLANAPPAVPEIRPTTIAARASRRTREMSFGRRVAKADRRPSSGSPRGVPRSEVAVALAHEPRALAGEVADRDEAALDRGERAVAAVGDRPDRPADRRGAAAAL